MSRVDFNNQGLLYETFAAGGIRSAPAFEQVSSKCHCYEPNCYRKNGRSGITRFLPICRARVVLWSLIATLSS